jgi:hypothetical protein
MTAKVVIDPDAASEDEPYAYLKPLVRALLAAGNEPSSPYGGHVPNTLGFYRDKDGWRCDLRDPIDFDLIAAEFALPPSIELNRATNSITDRRTWIQISGNKP